MYKMHRIQDSKHEIHFFRTEARKRKTIISEAWKLEEKIKEILYLIGIPYISNKFFLTLDVGCGMGGWSKILTKEGLNVTAIDISSESIKIAKNQFKAERINVPTIIGDMTMAPFKSEVFNICFCVQILHHFPDLNFIIPDLSRILTDNGKIILIEPNGSNIIFKIIKFIKEIIPKGWMVKKTFDNNE